MTVRLRPPLTRLHRWTGLALTLFLIVAGATGAMLPFQTELQRMIAPERFVAAPDPAPPIDWLALRRIAERRSGGVADILPLHRDDDAAISFTVAARAGQPPLGFDELLLDPYTGREISRATSGRLADGRAQIIPFLYRLHYSLALGDWGIWLFGIAALAWTIDCFVGFYLTLPTARMRWWQHWRIAWGVKLPPRNRFRLHFDLHRASGLWLWPMLFVFAWSSVGMNLRTVYDPVMTVLTGYRGEAPLAANATAAPTRLDWAEALVAARAQARKFASERGLGLVRERALYRDQATRSYGYVLRTSADRSDKLANSWFTIDGDTGRILRVSLPTGGAPGNTIDYWLGLLHTASVLGLPYRLLVSVIGLMIVLLSMTGLVIWARKRSARTARMRATLS